MLPVSKLQRKLLESRYSNSKGSIIPMHHAFKIIKFGPATRIGMIFMPVLFILGVWLSFGLIASFWDQVFNYWMVRLYENGHVGHMLIGVIGQSVNLPYPDLTTSIPVPSHVWLNILACVILFVLSFLLPGQMMPFTYLTRFTLIIQASVSVYFLISPDYFPYTLAGYVTDMLTLGMYILFMVPFVLALVFYIFDFPIWWKCFITVATLSFFIIGMPMQYMLHAYILHATSYLFLPVLYFTCGVLLDVLMFINFYAIGMAWSRDKSANLGRYA